MNLFRRILQYILSLAGASLFCILFLSAFAWFTYDTLDEIKWAVWLLGTITLFYVFIGSLIWELSFKIIHTKTKVTGGAIYFISGAVYGALSITILNSTIGEVGIIGWIDGITMMAIAAYIFYTIRKRPVSD